MNARIEKIENFLKGCIRNKYFPGAVYLVGEGSGIIAHGSAGHAVVSPVRVAMKEETIFDLASLTKPLCTALLSVILVGHRVFNLNDPVGKFIPSFKEGDKEKMRIVHLLLHTSGLPRWLPLYLHGEDLEARLRYLSRSGLEFQPGKKVLYGCPAYIVLSQIIRKATGEKIHKLFRDLVASPLKLAETEFNPPARKKEKIAASEKGNLFERRLAWQTEKTMVARPETAGSGLKASASESRRYEKSIAGKSEREDLLGREKKEKGKRDRREGPGGESERSVSSSARRYRDWREKIIWGEVHDHNAFTLGGVSGNAGLFSNAEELFILAREFLGTGKGILDRTERKLFFKNFTEGLNEDRTIGWQMASTRDSSAGPRLSEGSIGHTGFTGVSLWIDPERDRTYILLTNRTHPVYREFNMNALRRRFHRLASSL